MLVEERRDAVTAERDWSELDYTDYLGLAYIAQSPPQERGGFHPEAVKIARNAIVELERLMKVNDNLRAALRSAYGKVLMASHDNPRSEFYKQAVCDIETALAMEDGK